jgi:PhnB protein
MKEVTTYLNFDGNCGQAMKFYEKCVGAELQMTPFGETPGVPKEAKDRIMHARLFKGSGVLLMASDTMPGMPYQAGNNFSIAIQCDGLAEIEKLFAAFAENGKVTMPLQDMFWNARYGQLVDQFGVHWMFNFEHPKQG